MSHGGHAGHGDYVGRFRRLSWIMLVVLTPAVGFKDIFTHHFGYSL